MQNKSPTIINCWRFLEDQKTEAGLCIHQPKKRKMSLDMVSLSRDELIEEFLKEREKRQRLELELESQRERYENRIDKTLFSPHYSKPRAHRMCVQRTPERKLWILYSE